MRTVRLTTAPAWSQSDLDGAEVITPNRHAAHALGCPPLDLDRLAGDLLRAAGRLVAPPLLRLRFLRRAVREVLQGPSAERMAAVMEPALSRVLRAGIDPVRLSRGGPTARSRELGAVAARYHRLLNEAGLVDQAAAPRVAAAHVTERRRLAVLGYAGLEPGHLALLDQAAGDGSLLGLPWVPGGSLFRANETAAAWLEGHGWRVARDVPATARPLPAALVRPDGGAVEVHRYRAAGIEAEVRLVLAAVKERVLCRAAALDDMVVIVRDEQRYGPLLRDLAGRCGVPLELSCQVPVRETRIGWWVTQTLEALSEGLPFEATLRWTGARWTGADVTEQLAARRERRSGAAGWQAESSGLAQFEALSTGAPAAEWCRFLLSLVGRRAQAGTLLGSARDAVALRKLSAGLRELRDEAAPLDAKAFVAEVELLLDHVSVPYLPQRGGVAVHTPLAVFGASYRYGFVLGMAEGLTPQPVSDDPYLDFHEREQVNAWLGPDAAHLETAAEAARREQLSFWAMLRAVTDELVLTWPGSLDGRAAEPSPFLGELAPVDEPVPERFAAEAEWRGQVLRLPGGADPVTARARTAWQVEQRRESSAAADEHDGVLGEPLDLPASFSASQLTDLGQCPFKWLAAKAFGLEPVDEPDAEPDPLTRGGLFHRVLELAVRAARLDGCLHADGLAALLGPSMDAALGLGPAGHAETLARAVAESAAEAGEKTAVEDDDRGRFLGRLPNWARIREEWLAGLERAVRAESFLTEGAAPAELESWFRGIWLDLPVVGRVDRVDRGPDGVVLLDYKAGGSRPRGIAGRESGKLGIDLQLPLYRAVYGAGASGAYLLLGKGKRDGGPRDDQSAELEAFATEVLWRFDEGAFPVMPDVDCGACGFCEFSPICRVGQRNERKERT